VTGRTRPGRAPAGERRAPPSVHGRQVEDRKGDLLEYPKAVRALPFSDAGNTYFTNDNYNVNCSGDFPDNGGGKVCWVQSM